MLKIVINNCYGGFNLSYKGLKRYYELKYPGETLYCYREDYETGIYHKVETNEDSWCSILNHDFGESFKVDNSNSELFNNSYVSAYDIKRTDPALVQTVEELGHEADGPFSELVVKTIDSDRYRVCEYDGMEWIETSESIEWEIA
jgi:hypothetical protein